MMNDINMDLLPMKAHFFLFNAGSAPVVPFIPVYAKQLGFSSVIVGFIFTLLPIMGLIAKPTFGAIVDRFNCQKFVFQSSIILTIVAFLAVLCIPAIPHKPDVAVHCYQESFIKLCSDKILKDQCIVDKIISGNTKNETEIIKLTCDGNTTFLESVCNTWHIAEYCHADKPSSFSSFSFDAKLAPYHTIKDGGCLFIRMQSARFSGSAWHVPYCNDTLHQASCKMEVVSETLNEVLDAPDEEIITKYSFWVFTTMLILSWVGMAVIVSLGDAICFSLLGEFPSNYGKQRVWGAIGWGVFSVISGYLVDAVSEGQTHKNYSVVFYLMAVILFLDFLITFKIKYSPRPAANILKDVGKLLTKVEVVVFMMWCIVSGMCTALIWNFLFWFLEDLAGCESTEWTKTLEGLVMGVQCFGGEIISFHFSGWILKKIGHVHAMSLVLGAFGVRFLLYSVLTNPWWCLPIELFQGVTFSIFYATMASYASIVAPPGTENTIQGLFSAIFEGLGVSLGSLIGGIMFSQMKGTMVFRVSGLAAMVAFVFHVSVQMFLKRRSTTITTDEKEHE